MRHDKRQFGFTLFELITAMAVIAMLVALLVPSVRAMRKSYDSTGAEGMINAAFSSARALAAKERRYVGVRFQMEMNPDTTTWPVTPPSTNLNKQPYWKAPQYMIFIIYDANQTHLTGSPLTPTQDGKGFMAYPGLKPIKLPDNVGVMDLQIQTTTNASKNLSVQVTDPAKASASQYRRTESQLTDMTTFSVVFSPAGKMILTALRVKNKDGTLESSESNYKSSDDTFNTLTKVYNSGNTYPDPKMRAGRFVQDDYPAPPPSSNSNLGLAAEWSRSSFVIYDRDKFWDYRDKNGSKDNAPAQWKYLTSLPVRFVNPYSGVISSN